MVVHDVRARSRLLARVVILLHLAMTLTIYENELGWLLVGSFTPVRAEG